MDRNANSRRNNATRRDTRNQGKQQRGRSKQQRNDRQPKKDNNPTMKALDMISRNAGRISDDAAIAVVTKAFKAVVPSIVEIAKARMQGSDPAAASKIASIGHLTYGQVKDAAPKALVMAAEQQPGVFTEEFAMTLTKVIGTVRKHRSSFQQLRTQLRDDAAHGKIDAKLVALYHLTTGKLASLAVRGIQAMNEKPANNGTFNSINAQSTYQAIIKKHANNLNTLFAKSEDELKAICFYGYGPRDGKAIWTQLCDQVDRAIITRVRNEHKAAQGRPIQVRKSA